MARPTQTVKICDVQDRRATVQAKLPWVVRYTIDGRHRSKSFRTRIEAERYRGLLLQAVQDRASIDETTSEPESWQTPLRDVRIHEWARRWLAEGGRSGNRELGRRRPRHGAVQHHRCRQSAKLGPRRAASPTSVILWTSAAMQRPGRHRRPYDPIDRRSCGRCRDC